MKITKEDFSLLMGIEDGTNNPNSNDQSLEEQTMGIFGYKSSRKKHI